MLDVNLPFGGSIDKEESKEFYDYIKDFAIDPASKKVMYLSSMARNYHLSTANNLINFIYALIKSPYAPFKNDQYLEKLERLQTVVRSQLQNVPLTDLFRKVTIEKVLTVIKETIGCFGNDMNRMAIILIYNHANIHQSLNLTTQSNNSVAAQLNAIGLFNDSQRNLTNKAVSEKQSHLEQCLL